MLELPALPICSISLMLTCYYNAACTIDSNSIASFFSVLVPASSYPPHCRLALYFLVVPQLDFGTLPSALAVTCRCPEPWDHKRRIIRSHLHLHECIPWQLFHLIPQRGASSCLMMAWYRSFQKSTKEFVSLSLSCHATASSQTW